MSRLFLLVLAFGALAAPASAASLGEIPPLVLRGDEDCAGPTGTPGEIAVEATDGVRFINATRAGFQFGPVVKLGASFHCSTTVTRAGGAGVILGEGIDGILGSVRDPGGAWSAPFTVVAKENGWNVNETSAAVSDRGDVIVVVEESSQSKYRTRVLRRAPGGSFAAPEPFGVTATRRSSFKPAIASTGEAFMLSLRAKNVTPPVRVAVEVAMAPPGAPFGAPVPIADTGLLSTPDLDVAADGRALVAVPDRTSIIIAERAPGAAFGPATRLAAAADDAFVAAGVKLGADGAAAVAWQRALANEARIATRTTPGPFSAPVVAYAAPPLVSEDYDRFYFSETFLTQFGGFFSPGLGQLPVVLTADGRAALAATAPTSMRLASVPLAGGAVVDAQTGAGYGRDQGEEMLLADGTPAVFWTDSAITDFGGSFTGDDPYQLHLAAEGVVERPDPPAPTVTVGAPASRTVRASKPLRLPVTCSAACEVHAAVVSPIEIPTGGVLRLNRAGRGDLEIDGAAFAAPERLGPMRLTLSYSAPDALHPVKRAVTVRVVRGAGLAIPRVTALSARREGNRIRVRFRVEHPDAEFPFFVSGDDTRTYDGEPLVTRTVKGRRAVSLTLPASEGLRYVIVRPPVPLGVPNVVVRVR